MNEVFPLILAFLGGVLLGALFFGGLWWSIQKGVTSRVPALWFFGSLLLRMGAALTGFYYIGGTDWQRLVSCLIGFVVARMVTSWVIRPIYELKDFRKEGISHAP